MQKETRSSILKVYRQGDPLTCQRIWDVIKDLRVERKLASTKENVVQEYCKKYNAEGKYVKEQLKFLTEDKLILQKTIAAVKGSNKGVEQIIYVIPLDSEIDLKGKNDWYCFQCHKPGEVLNCISCPRVYHVKCLENLEAQNTEAFICPSCKEVELDTDVEDQDARRALNDLVYYACARLEEKLPLEKYVWKQKALTNIAVTPHTTDRCAARLTKITKELINAGSEEEWRVKFLLRWPLITVPKIMDKADRQVYKSLGQFQLDSLTIVHNITVFYGENDILADAARTMLRTCKFEIGEINLCRDCYKRSNEPEGPDWFCLPCNPPHQLVYAKARGFPFWPAKVLNITKNNQYDVRFFGQGHDRLTLDKIHTKPIDAIKAPPKKSAAWCKAVEELKKHQAMLADEAGTLSQSEEKSDDDMDSQEENVSPAKSTSDQSFNLKSCKVFLNNLDYQSLINKIDKRLEPVITDSELPFTEESVISQEESNEHAMLDLMMLQDNPIFPEVNEIEIETAEKVMMDFTASSAAFQSNESNIELLAAREKMAAFEKEIDSKKQKIEEQDQLIKSQHQEIEALRESNASKIRNQQQEMEILKESHASAIRILMENHADEIARAKIKVWCSNQCRSEGIYHCCVTTSYCSLECQLDHWKKGHKRSCRRERGDKEHGKRLIKDLVANK